MATTRVLSWPRPPRTLAKLAAKAAGSSTGTNGRRFLARQPARQFATRQFKEIAKQRLTVAAEISEIDAAFGAVNRRGQRDRHDIEELVARRVGAPGARKLGRARPDRQHPGPPGKRGPNKNPSNRAVSTGEKSLCDSPARCVVNLNLSGSLTRKAPNLRAQLDDGVMGVPHATTEFDYLAEDFPSVSSGHILS
jgi:hypothetical protein